MPQLGRLCAKASSYDFRSMLSLLNVLPCFGQLRRSHRLKLEVQTQGFGYQTADYTRNYLPLQLKAFAPLNAALRQD
jgi:hypothetical protein